MPEIAEVANHEFGEQQLIVPPEKPFLSEEDKRLLRENSLALFRADDQNLFLHMCEKTRLYPLTGQIWARPEREEKGPDGKWKKMLVITGIWGFLTVADRSGVYDGSSPLEWCGKNGEWVDIWLQDEAPFAARGTTWRKDHSRPEIAVVRFKAVASLAWKDPRNFWVKMPDWMVGKCALAASLRKLFPNQLSGLYESSEIDGGVPEMMETPMSALEKDILAQKERIAESEAAMKRLTADGATVVTPSAPVVPRDAVKEVEPALPADKVRLGQPDATVEDDIDITPVGDEKDSNWWRSLSCDPIPNSNYKGKTIEELDHYLLRQAVEKWVPRVRAKADATKAVKDLADALEFGLAEAEKAAAQMEAQKAATAAEGAQ